MLFMRTEVYYVGSYQIYDTTSKFEITDRRTVIFTVNYA